MQIEKEQNRFPFQQATALDRHARPAAEYVAVFRTRLALARWTRGGDVPHIASPTRPLPARAVWYAQAQNQFLAWLADGGVHRPEPDSLAGIH